jgi:hypothetical protein
MKFRVTEEQRRSFAEAPLDTCLSAHVFTLLCDTVAEIRDNHVESFSLHRGILRVEVDLQEGPGVEFKLLRRWRGRCRYVTEDFTVSYAAACNFHTEDPWDDICERESGMMRNGPRICEFWPAGMGSGVTIHEIIPLRKRV